MFDIFELNPDKRPGIQKFEAKLHHAVKAKAAETSGICTYCLEIRSLQNIP